MRSSRRFLRCVSLVTVSCFLFTQAGFAAPIDGISVSGGAAGPELPFAGHFQVPENLGAVSETYAVTSADRSLRERAIVLIQNGHGSYDAQRKVRELLRYLDTTYGIKTVFVEGAAEKLDASKIEFFADEERNRKVAEYLAEQGILNGAGLYLAEHPKGVEGLGLEDVKLYRANYEALKTVFEASARVEKILSRIETRLFSTYSRYASPRLREAVADWQRFENGRREFMPFVNRLLEQVREVLGLDMRHAFSQLEWPQTVRLMALQEIEKSLDPEKAAEERSSLMEFLRSRHVAGETIRTVETVFGETEPEALVDCRAVFETLLRDARPKGLTIGDWPHFTAFAARRTLKRELDAPALFREIEKLFRMLTDSLAGTPEEKRFVGLQRDLALISKLLRLELTRDEYTDLRERRVSLKSLMGDLGMNVKTPARRTERGVRGKEQSGDAGGMKEVFTAALRFYAFANERERVFYENIDREMRERKLTKAAVLTGGFHTDGLRGLLKESRASYAVVTPHLSEASDRRLYKDAMLGKSTGGIVNRDADEPVPAGDASAAFLDVVQPQQTDAAISAMRGADYRAELRDAASFIGEVFKNSEAIKVNEQDIARAQPSESRAESRLPLSNEKKLRKAMSDLQPKWWDWIFKRAGEARIAAAEAVVKSDPVFNLIMTKAPEIPSSRALMLFGEAKRLFETKGDFDVIKKPDYATHFVGTGEYYESYGHEGNGNDAQLSAPEMREAMREVREVVGFSWSVVRHGKDSRSELRTTRQEKEIAVMKQWQRLTWVAIAALGGTGFLAALTLLVRGEAAKGVVFFGVTTATLAGAGLGGVIVDVVWRKTSPYSHFLGKFAIEPGKDDRSSDKSRSEARQAETAGQTGLADRSRRDTIQDDIRRLEDREFQLVGERYRLRTRYYGLTPEELADAPRRLPEIGKALESIRSSLRSLYQERKRIPEAARGEQGVAASDRSEARLGSDIRKKAIEISELIAKRDALPETADLLVVFGGPDSARVAAEAAKVFAERKVSRVIVSGRFGKHIKAFADDPDRGVNEQTGEEIRAEALIMRDVLISRGVPADAIWVEKASQGMTDNGVFSVDILKQRIAEGFRCRSVIFMHGPLLQLRGTLALREAMAKAGVSAKIYDLAASLSLDPGKDKDMEGILWQASRLTPENIPLIGGAVFARVRELVGDLLANEEVELLIGRAKRDQIKKMYDDASRSEFRDGDKVRWIHLVLNESERIDFGWMIEGSPAHKRLIDRYNYDPDDATFVGYSYPVRLDTVESRELPAGETPWSGRDGDEKPGITSMRTVGVVPAQPVAAPADISPEILLKKVYAILQDLRSKIDAVEDSDGELWNQAIAHRNAIESSLKPLLREKTIAASAARIALWEQINKAQAFLANSRRAEVRSSARSENRFGDEFVSGGKVRESRPAGETSYDADGERLESLLRRARSDRDVIGNEIGMLERDPAKLRNPRSNESRRLAILKKQEVEAQDRVTRYERQLADHKSRSEARQAETAGQTGLADRSRRDTIQDDIRRLEDREFQLVGERDRLRTRYYGLTPEELADAPRRLPEIGKALESIRSSLRSLYQERKRILEAARGEQGVAASDRLEARGEGAAAGRRVLPRLTGVFLAAAGVIAAAVRPVLRVIRNARMDPEKLYPLATGAMRKKIEAAMHENPAHSGFVVEHVSWKRWGREFLESLEILLSQGSPNILDEKIRLVSDRRGPIVLANYQAARDLGRRAGGAGVTIANAHKDAPRVRVNLDIFAAKPRAEVRNTDVRRKAGSALLTGLVTPLAAFAGMYRSGDDDFLSYFMNEHPVGFWIWTALMVFTLANLVRTNKHLSMNRYRRSISRVNPSRRQQILDGILRQMQFYLKRISAVEENIRARQAAVAMIKTWQAEEESGNEKHMRISPVDPEVFAAKERELRSMLERFPIKRFRELFLKAAMAATDSGSQDLIEVFQKFRYFMKIRNAFAPAKGVRSAVHYSFSPGPEAAEHLSPQSDDPEDDPEFERLLRATLSREELNERLGKVSGVDEAVAEARAQEDFDAVILEAFGDVRFEDAGARLAMVSFLGSLAQDRLENPVYVRQAAVTALRKIGGSDSLALANQAMEDPDMLSREVRLPAKCSRREAIEKIVEGMTWVLGTEAVREQYSGVQKRIRRLFRENPGMLGFLKKYPLRLFSIQDKPKIDSIILGDFRRYWFNVVGLIHFQFEIDGDRSIPHEVKRTMEVRSRETPIDMGLAVEIFKNQFLLSGVVHHEYLHYTGILSEGVVLLKQINFMKGLIVRKTLFMLEKNREATERELALAMGEMGILPLANYFADSADDKYLAGLNADILRLYGPDHMSADQVEEESARIIDSISRYIEQRNSELSAERLLDPGKTLYEPLSDRDKDRIRRLVKETRSIRNTLTLDEFRSIKDKSFASTVWDAYLAQGGGRIFSEIAAFLKVVSSGTSDRLGARSENRFGDEFVSGGKVRESRPAGETSYDADGERLESLLRRARSDRNVIGNEIGMLERDPAKLRNPRSNESRRLAILKKQEVEAQDRVTRYERQLADHKSRPELRLLMGDEGTFFSNLIDPSQIVLDNRSIVSQDAQAARAGSQVAPKETRAELRMTANAPVRKRVRKTVKETEEPLPVVDRFAVANGLGMELKLLREERLSDRTLAAVAHGGVLALDATSAEILQSVREVQAALNLTGISDALKAFSAAASSDPGLLLAPSDAKGGLVVPVSGLPEIGQIARDVFAMIVNTEVRKAYVAEGISADTARSVLASFAHVRDLKGNPVLGRLEIVPAAKGDMIRAVTGAGAALAYRLGMKPCDVLVLLEGARYAAIREKIAETALVSDLGERADLAPARDYLAMGAAMLNVRLDNDAWTLLNQRVADALRKKDGFFEMDRNALAGLAAILTQIFAQERATATAA